MSRLREFDFDERSVIEMLRASDAPFKKCANCGKLHQPKYAHSCQEATGEPERPSEDLTPETLRQMDEGPPSEVVYISPNTRSNQRYHIRADTNATPNRCTAILQRDEDSKWKPVTRAEAFARGCRPCLKCYRIGVELSQPPE